MAQEYCFQSAGLTHVGKVRKHNEDAFLDRPDLGLWLVADGMGGHSSGDVASRLIVDTLNQVPPPATASDLMAEVRSRLAQVNDILRQTAEARGPGTIIASTVVALLAFGPHFAAVWAGDSRLYVLRDQRLSQVTEDHSHVQEMVNMGLLDEEEAARHPSANVVTRAVGAHAELELEVIQDRLQPGDVFLLCSDGLTRMMADAEIEDALNGGPLKDCVERLVQLSLDRGAKDNVTAILVEAQPQESGGPDDERTIVPAGETI
jgi:serine/threonine protein phosphatase PrpC